MKSLTPSQKRRARERQELTERIMDAARTLFVQDGYEAVTLSKVAEAVEYSQGTIYQYFKDKRALVMAIIQADYCSLQDQFKDCHAIEDPIERLVTMARRFAAWGVSHPNHVFMMTLNTPDLSESRRELLEHKNPPIEQDVFYLLSSFVGDAYAAGIVRDEYPDPGVVAFTLAAAIQGFVIQEINLTDRERELLQVTHTTLEDRVGTLIQVLVDGFLKPGWRDLLHRK